MRPGIDVHPDRQTVIELVWRSLRFPKASTPSRRTMAWASCALPCCKIQLELDLSTDSGTEGSTSTPPASPVYVSVVFQHPQVAVMRTGSGPYSMRRRRNFKGWYVLALGLNYAAAI